MCWSWPRPRPSSLDAHRMVELWEEAFTTLSAIRHATSSSQSFWAGTSGCAQSSRPSNSNEEEVTRQKAIAERMNEAYQELRRAGFSFEELAEANLQGMFRVEARAASRSDWVLARPRSSPGAGWRTDPSPLTLGARPNACHSAWRVVTELAEQYPAIAERAGRLPGLGGASLHANPCAIRHCCAPRSRPLATAKCSPATSWTSSISFAGSLAPTSRRPTARWLTSCANGS